MTAALQFRIEDGVFALSVVDKAAVGYLEDWQTPGGVDIDAVTLAAYTDTAAHWSCQVQAMTIDPSADTTTETVEATWCEPAQTIPNPAATSFAINGTAVADAHVNESLQAFLYLHDVQEAYFFMGLAGAEAPPAAAGRCRIVASAFGGAGHTTLTMTIGALPVTRRYDLWYGAAPGTVIEGLTNTERPGAATASTRGSRASKSTSSNDAAA